MILHLQHITGQSSSSTACSGSIGSPRRLAAPPVFVPTDDSADDQQQQQHPNGPNQTCNNLNQQLSLVASADTSSHVGSRRSSHSSHSSRSSCSSRSSKNSCSDSESDAGSPAAANSPSLELPEIPSWQFYGGRSGWVDFDEAANQELEQSHIQFTNGVSSNGYLVPQLEGVGQFQLHIAGRFTYRIDFTEMTQTNSQTNRVRKIRRETKSFAVPRDASGLSRHSPMA